MALRLFRLAVQEVHPGDSEVEERGMAGRRTGTNGTTGNTTTTTNVATGAPNANGVAPSPTRSGPIAAAGVSTGEDFANLMSALMSDVIDGSISPIVANATVNAGGKLLKVVEMQYKYGSPKAQEPLVLTLAPGR